MKPIIEVKNLGKKYQIRHYKGKYIALRDVLTSIIKSPFSFAKEKAKNIVGIKTKEEFWALQNVNFEIMPGEVVGIIGRNGAGKSTLLKILTGITPPSTGEVVMRGRPASLLEVGTGFHPELTGRENIFLNGAILGMTRKEIAKNFDSIVAFAEVEKFLDTPVKFYSSGMYVRLAFSVAAHMEPDILLVDEVLAVGDAEFQKKCLGKMEEVTKTDGRTILFVSHNMAAIQSLCRRCILIEKGQVKMIGETAEVVNHYLNSAGGTGTSVTWDGAERPGNDIVRLDSCKLINREGQPIPYVYSDQEFGVKIDYEVLKPGHSPLPNLHFFTSKGEYAFISHANMDQKLDEVGRHSAIAWLPANLFNNGTYTIGIALSTMMPLKIHCYERDALDFQVLENIETAKKNDYNQKIHGVLRPRLTWDLS